MTQGFDRPLDHRGSFETGMFGWKGANVEPDVWKIEGLDRPEDCKCMVRPPETAVGKRLVHLLGRGEDDAKVREWLTVAAGVPGFIGFAVGRTDFWEPLVGWRSKKITREAAVSEIAQRYCEFADIFGKARAE